jgi:hypothetical protein
MLMIVLFCVLTAILTWTVAMMVSGFQHFDAELEADHWKSIAFSQSKRVKNFKESYRKLHGRLDRSEEDRAILQETLGDVIDRAIVLATELNEKSPPLTPTRPKKLAPKRKLKVSIKRKK